MPGRFRHSRRASPSRSPSSISESFQVASTGCWGWASWRLQRRSVHPSTWKGNSQKIVGTAFSEVRAGILDGSFAADLELRWPVQGPVINAMGTAYPPIDGALLRLALTLPLPAGFPSSGNSPGAPQALPLHLPLGLLPQCLRPGAIKVSPNRF
jgi:hypothetical protein